MISADHSSSSSITNMEREHLRGRRVAVVVFSHYPSDPRPRREAETLAQLGMEVDVISIKQNEDGLGRETFNGVNILRVPIKHRRGGKVAFVFQYVSFILISFFLLAFRSVTRRYCLVHVHNMPDVLVFAGLVPKMCGAKVMLDLHDPMPELMMTIFGLEQQNLSVRLLKKFEKWSIGFSHLVVTPNIAFQKLFGARSCPAGKLQVIMNCPDEDIFQFREVADQSPVERSMAKPFVLMYHGALVERHGLDIAVKAFDSVRASIPNVELRIFGRRTPFLDQVMDLVRKLGLEDSVKYMGAKSLEQIVQAIDDCDLGIIPNRRSVFTEMNMPTRIFEYLARAKPVVAPRTLGIQDYFKKDEIIFFEPDNWEDLACKVHYVYSKPRDVNEVIRRGQAVYQGHRWSEERLRFVRVASELMGGNDGWSKRQAKPFIKPTV